MIVVEPNVATSLASTATSSSLMVTWDVPDSGLVEKYVVELKNMPGTKQEVAAVSVKTATFTSLEAGTQYTVVMGTVSGNQTSDNVETIVFTRMYTYATIYRLRHVITTLLLMLVVEFICNYFAYIHMDFQNNIHTV